MNRITLALAILAGTIVSTPVKAEPLNSQQMIDWLQRGGTLETSAKFHISGYFDGMLWSNTYVRSFHNVRIYCQPEKLAINGEQAVSMFRKYLNEHPDDLGKPVGLVALATLKETFPCE